MTFLRRFCALGVSGLIVGALMSGVTATTASSAPLKADTAEAFAGTASAQALRLGLFGTNLTVSSSNAVANSSPMAHADGSGVALITATVSSADSVGANQSSAPGKACGLNIPLTGILNLALACSQSAAQTTSATPAALASSNIADLDVSVLSTILNLLQPILNALVPIADQVLSTVVTTVQNIVQPVLGTTLTNLLGALGIKPSAPVSSLITALENATQLLTVHVGDTASSVVTTAGSVVADSDAQGAQISVLPALGLLTITVGEAHTTSTFSRSAGTSSATFSPAILTITSKVLPIGTITVQLGSPITLFAGTALESTISLGAGTTVKNPDGSVGAVADGVGIDLLKGINGGISLHLAHAQSAVGGNAAAISTTTTTGAAATTTTAAAPPVTGTLQAKLATTGTDAPLLPIGFVLLLAGYLTRRSFRARRAARTPR
jgi:hypothetical protein